MLGSIARRNLSKRAIPSGSNEDDLTPAIELRLFAGGLKVAHGGRSQTQKSPAQVEYSTLKSSLFRIADSVVRFRHEQELRKFEMPRGVVDAPTTKSIRLHDLRGKENWMDDLIPGR